MDDYMNSGFSSMDDFNGGNFGEMDVDMGGGTGNTMSFREWNRKLIPVMVILGVLAWIVGRFLYGALHDSLPRPILIGLVFAVLAAILAAGLFVMGMQAGTDSGSSPAQVLFLLGSCVAVFLLAALFQFIYGLTPEDKVVAPTSYVFLIDDSGSMSSNDPYGQRFEAIGTILEDRDETFPFMVYRFSNGCEIVREMAPKGDGVQEMLPVNSGGTSILGTLETVINDYESGIWTGGSTPKVVLLTDGIATDMFLEMGLSNVLNEYSKNRISISCVGLGTEIDRGLLDKISSQTGGVFVEVTNASQLSGAMLSAASGYRDSLRDLVSVRTNGTPGILYAFLRVLFLTLLGLLLAFIKYLGYGDSDSMKSIVVISGAASLAGALILEIATALGAPAEPVWLLLWILYSLTLAEKNSMARSNINIVTGF